MAPVTFGGPSSTPSRLLLLLLLLSLFCVGDTQIPDIGNITLPPGVITIITGNTTLSPGRPNKTTAQDPGGEDVVEPVTGGPTTTLPPDDLEIDNTTTIFVGSILALLLLGSIAALVWKFRSVPKPGEPQAPPEGGELDAAELEPKGSQLE